MSYYLRHLPHWQPAEAALFVTWRLHGSLPASVAQRVEPNPGKAFLAFDRELDKAVRGPLWLKDQRVADSVVSALRFGEDSLKLYKLIAYVVMANHVHMLIEPYRPLAEIMRMLKGFTARKANQILARTGHRFWQEESFDHWVRNDSEFRKIVRYIESNPVTAGLVERPENWPWSSASWR